MVKGELRWATGEYIVEFTYGGGTEQRWVNGERKLQQCVYNGPELVWQDVPEVNLVEPSEIPNDRVRAPEQHQVISPYAPPNVLKESLDQIVPELVVTADTVYRWECPRCVISNYIDNIGYIAVRCLQCGELFDFEGLS